MWLINPLVVFHSKKVGWSSYPRSYFWAFIYLTDNFNEANHDEGIANFVTNAPYYRLATKFGQGMFLHVSVILFTGGACVAGGRHAWQGGMHGKREVHGGGHAWQGGGHACIKPDMPINIDAWFCLSTAKSKFSLVSPVADWWKTITNSWIDLFINKSYCQRMILWKELNLTFTVEFGQFGRKMPNFGPSPS